MSMGRTRSTVGWLRLGRFRRSFGHDQRIPYRGPHLREHFEHCALHRAPTVEQRRNVILDHQWIDVGTPIFGMRCKGHQPCRYFGGGGYGDHRVARLHGSRQCRRGGQWDFERSEGLGIVRPYAADLLAMSGAVGDRKDGAAGRESHGGIQ